MCQILLRGARSRTHRLRRDPQSVVVRDSQDHTANQLWVEEHKGKEREPQAGRVGWAPSPSGPPGQEAAKVQLRSPMGHAIFSNRSSGCLISLCPAPARFPWKRWVLVHSGVLVHSCQPRVPAWDCSKPLSESCVAQVWLGPSLSQGDGAAPGAPS